MSSDQFHIDNMTKAREVMNGERSDREAQQAESQAHLDKLLTPIVLPDQSE